MTTRNKRCCLAIAFATIAVVWLGVLPRLCDQPHIAQHIRIQQQLNIDPSALFYSELDVMPSIIHRVELLNLLPASSGLRKSPPLVRDTI